MNRLRRPLTRWILLTAALSLGCVSPTLAWSDLDELDDEHSAEKMAVDALVVRPVGFAATVLGSVLYVISLPFSYAGGNQTQAQQALVEDPAQFTFQRPLGEDF